jgi:hypothetical protein
MLTPREERLPPETFDGNPFFVKSARFQGAQTDYVFKRGECGVGYYFEFAHGFLEKLRSNCEGLPGLKTNNKPPTKTRRSSITEGELFTSMNDTEKEAKLMVRDRKNSTDPADAFAEWRRARAASTIDKYSRRSSDSRSQLETHLKQAFENAAEVIAYCERNKVCACPPPSSLSPPFTPCRTSTSKGAS